MLFYADRQKTLDPVDVTSRTVEAVERAAHRHGRRQISPYKWALGSHAGLVGAVVDFGELHQAVADRLNQTRDELSPELDAFVSAATLLGRCVYRSYRILARRPPEAVSAPALAGATASGGAAAGTRALFRKWPGLRSVHTQPESSETCAQPGSSDRVAPGPHPETDIEGLLKSAAVAVAEAGGLANVGPLPARVPEGYAFYSLYPEMYFASAERAIEALRPSGPVVVLGIRSIGASLAPAVAAVLIERGLPVWTATLRPRGHPFERYVDLGPCMVARLASAAKAGATFLVVDEGPGLTCSSFLSVCSALGSMGVQEDRIAILSAWRGSPSIYASEESRQRWKRLRLFYTDAAEAFDGWRALLPFVQAAFHRASPGHDGYDLGVAPEIEDLSYGRWRERCYASADHWPVVHRASERTKLLIRDRRGASPILAKFAGLGEYGRQKHLRAVTLARAGFSPPVVGLAHGFLLYRFLEEARPLEVADLTPSLLERMVDYYAFIARRFRLPAAPRFDSLAQMVSFNARAALGADPTPFLERWRPSRDAIDRLPLVLLDGKPQPHEWLRVGTQSPPVFLKADSADHFRDHTLVGDQSILWDLAGCCEEWELAPEEQRTLTELWSRKSGDAEGPRLLEFYRAAYLSFRVAALHYAVHSTDEEEIRRSLQHEQWRYRHRLATVLAHDGQGVGVGTTTKVDAVVGDAAQ